MDYYYEIFNLRESGGIKQVSCRVYNLNETQIEVFDFMITKEKEYMAWTYDTVSTEKINRRKEIERELNNQKL